MENPIRRKILAKLAREQHYPLQLSKELNISQQAIMKHLKVLKDNDLVISFEEKSTLGGPPRKSYVAKKHISLRIDIGPNTFSSEIYDYHGMEEPGLEDRKVEDEDKKIKNYEEEFKSNLTIKDTNTRLVNLSKLIRELNGELEDLKLKRSKLLNLREHVVKESNVIISNLCREYDERKILYYLLMHTTRDISTISEAMEMREKVIEEIFKNLMKQRILLNFEDEIF